jgi:hypothetical protein
VSINAFGGRYTKILKFSTTKKSLWSEYGKIMNTSSIPPIIFLINVSFEAPPAS